MLASVTSSKEVLVISVICFLVFVIILKHIHSILKHIKSNLIAFAELGSCIK